MKLDVIELLNKMKITIYELLGLIKDGKAPKKVKYGSTTYVYTYKGGMSEAYDYIDDEGNYLFERLTKYNYLTNMLTNEVEIIEEKKMCYKCGKYPAEYNQTWCEFCLGISEEDKEIEELNLMFPICNDIKDAELGGFASIYRSNLGEIKYKFGELIKEVNKLKKEGK